MVPSQLLGEHLTAFLMQYIQILDNLNMGCSFDVKLDRLDFVSVPNCLEFCDRKMPLIMTDRKHIYWRRQAGHFSSSSCVEKKASRLPATGDPNAALVDTVSSAVLASRLTFPTKTDCADKKKEGGE